MAKSTYNEESSNTCKGITKSGAPCKSVGLDDFDGYCWIHYTQAQGRGPVDVVLECQEAYMNGAIGIKPVKAGQRISVSPQKYEQIMGDSPTAFRRVS